MYRKAWAQICEISRREFDQVYQRLGVHLEEKVYFSFLCNASEGTNLKHLHEHLAQGDLGLSSFCSSYLFNLYQDLMLHIPFAHSSLFAGRKLLQSIYSWSY
jgi:hypothetical protein